ncbi:MAG TPA: hypothetical protein VFX28_19890, partial [Methylomirabilota bacterium]|nr:hypothetical protein [Methylomirabilota bacterium]
MRVALAAAVLLALLAVAGCATVPDHAYYPLPSAPDTVAVARALHQAAEATGDDPRRYSFALIQGVAVSAYAVGDATFYFSEGLAR